MVRVHERGSVVGYIVVGILLMAAVIGGVYVTKHQLQPAGASRVATTNDGNNGYGGTATQQAPTKNSGNAGTQSPSSNTGYTQPSTSQGTSGSSAKNTPQMPQGSQNTNQQTGTPGLTLPSGSSTGTSSSNLPQTGPADALATAFVLAILFGAYITYRRSHDL